MLSTVNAAFEPEKASQIIATSSGVVVSFKEIPILPAPKFLKFICMLSALVMIAAALSVVTVIVSKNEPFATVKPSLFKPSAKIPVRR
ncbi:hypothetical protein D3C87_1622390 [compost metagenome]